MIYCLLHSKLFSILYFESSYKWINLKILFFYLIIVYIEFFKIQYMDWE